MAVLLQEERKEMTTLLEFREKIKIFLGKYDIYLFPLLKFTLALVAFMMINENIGFMTSLKNPAIALILALMCSFLPVNTIAAFGAVLILAHAYALSLEVFAVAAAMILVIFSMFFRMAPQYGYLLVLTPIAFALKVPYILPLAMGLLGTPLAAIPLGCGIIVHYLIYYMKMNTTMLSGTESEDMKQKLMYLIDNVIRNKEMLLMVVAFALTVLVVYVIRRMSIDYSWTIAISVGAVVNLVVLLTGSMFMDVSLKIFSVFMGNIISALIAVVLQFTIFSLDYSRTEYVQFEDDEYYYYVKAVPKITIVVPEKTVKKISTQKKAGTGKKKSSISKRATGRLR